MGRRPLETNTGIGLDDKQDAHDGSEERLVDRGIRALSLCEVGFIAGKLPVLRVGEGCPVNAPFERFVFGARCRPDGGRERWQVSRQPMPWWIAIFE